jgi:hypothetical protein
MNHPALTSMLQSKTLTAADADGLDHDLNGYLAYIGEVGAQLFALHFSTTYAEAKDEVVYSVLVVHSKVEPA